MRGLYLQVAADRLLPLGLGAGQLLPQHLLPHVDGLQRLLDVKEVLLQRENRSCVSSTTCFPSVRVGRLS